MRDSLGSNSTPRPGRGFPRPPGVILDLPLGKRDGATFRCQSAWGRVCTAYGTGWTPRGWYFDRVDDQLKIPGNPFDLQTFSVIFRVRPNSTGVFQTIMRVGNAVNYYGWALTLRDSNLFRIAAVNNAGALDWQALGVTAAAADTEYCVGATCPGPGGEVALYVNGQLEGVATQTTIAYSSSANCIGLTPAGTLPFGGHIKDGLVTATALSAVEHLDYYRQSEAGR
jgi:hypothetical protein